MLAGTTRGEFMKHPAFEFLKTAARETSLLHMPASPSKGVQHTEYVRRIHIANLLCNVTMKPFHIDLPLLVWLDCTARVSRLQFSIAVRT